MPYDKSTSAALVAAALADAGGFSGRFFYDAERGDVAYIAKACDDKHCDCEWKVNSDGDQDCSVSLDDFWGEDHVCEPLVGMLNRQRAMAEQLRAAMELVDQLRAAFNEQLPKSDWVFELYRLQTETARLESELALRIPDRTSADIQRLADVVLDYMERNGVAPQWATETLCRMIRGGKP